MSTKVTRRIAIGTMIGGLAAGPFVMYALKRMRQNELVSLSETERNRDTCVKEICRINNLSREQVEIIVSEFAKEKENWLRFREVDASAAFDAQGRKPKTSEWKSIATAGQLSFVASLMDRKNQADEFPWDFYLKYIGNNNEDTYSYSVFGDHSSTSFVGKPIEAADHTTVLQLLSSPLVYFTQFLLVPSSHIPVLLASSDYKIKLLGDNSKDASCKSFILSSEGKDGGVDAFFENGFYCGHRGNGAMSQPSFNLSINKYVQLGNINYPSEFKISLGSNNKDEKQISFAMLLSHLNVKQA